MADCEPPSNAGAGASGSGASDRWSRLFADIEAELSAAEEAEFAAEVADRTRLEFTRVRMIDRLRAAVNSVVTLTMNAGASAAELRGSIIEVGPDWLLVDPRIGVDSLDRSGQGAQVLVRLGAVLTVSGLPTTAAAPGSVGAVEARYDLRMVLRKLARDRAASTITLTSGVTIHGTLDRVGADFVDIARHPIGEPRRNRSVWQIQTVSQDALGVIRT